MKSILKLGLILLLLQAVPDQAAPTVTQAAAGGSHSLFLTSDGSLWGMGYDVDGELGVVLSYYETNRPVEIVSNNVVTVAAGGMHSLFIKSDGSLWAMGDNEYGQLGDGTSSDARQPEEIVSNNVVTIAAGGAHSLFIKSDGSLWAMGWDYYGQLGDGAYGNRYNDVLQPEEIVSNDVVAIAAGGSHSLFIAL